MNFKLLILTIGLTILFALTPRFDLAQAQSPTEPTIEKSDATGITLAWSPADYAVTDSNINGQLYSQIRMPGTTATGQPGYPQLPVYNTLVGLPPTGEATLRIIDVQRETVQLPNTVLPEAVPQISDISLSNPDSTPPVGGGKSEHIPDATIYATDAFYPNAVAQLGPAEQVRDRRVARLSINPLRVNPVTGEMEVVRFVRVEITFSQPAPPPEFSVQQVEPNVFDQTLNTLLLNPEAVTWPAVPSPAPEFGVQGVGVQSAGDSIKVRVNSPGLYAITYADLQAAGFGSLLAGVDPKTFKLSYGYPRQEVAIIVEGEADGNFDPGDRILFYAPLRENIYVDYNIYFLEFGDNPGVRMGPSSGDPTGLPVGTAWRTAEAEVNKIYDTHFEADEDDYWYWNELVAPASSVYSLSFDLPDTSGPDATLSVWFYSLTNFPTITGYNHKVEAYINNTYSGTETWLGQGYLQKNYSVPANVLQNGVNQVNLRLPSIPGVIGESVYLDEIAITYPARQAPSGQFQFTGETGQNKYSFTNLPSTSLSVYDITNPDNPQQVSGYVITGTTLTVGDAVSSAATYQVVPGGNIKTPTSFELAKTMSDPPGGADYVIVTHPNLTTPAQSLKTYREGQGLRVAILNVEDIYDAFGPGHMDAEAIRNALEYAYHNWVSPKPLYAVLIGDGSYDFKNYTSSNSLNLVPPYLLYVDPWWGETATDNRLVTFTGSDTLPDMFIGRLSVNNVAEANTVINKIINYETAPPEGAWRAKHLFVADDQDSAGNFHAFADEGYNELVDSLEGDRYYLSPPTGADYTYANASALTSDLINAFNQGAGLVTFHGHSSWHQWAVESLLHIDNIGQLNNQGRLPIVSEMTCFTGLFHHATDQSMDELLVRRAGGGAIAAWGSTGLGVASGHEKLQSGFYQKIMHDGETVLGAATFAGKLRVHITYGPGATGVSSTPDQYLSLLDTYTLFGDPAMNFASVFNPDVSITQQVSDSNAQPGDTVTFTLTIKNTGVGTATNVVVNNLLSTDILSETWSTSFAGISVDGRYTWQLPDLGPNASGTIQIVGVINPALPEDFSIANGATISSNLSELTLNNNSSWVFIGARQVYLPIVIRGG